MPDLPIGPSVRDAISDLPDLDAFDELLRRDAVRLSPAIRECMQCVASPYARLLSGLDVDESDLSWPRRRSPSRLTSSLRTVHTEDVVYRFAMVVPGEQEPVSRLVRLHMDGIGPTLRAGSAPDRGSYSAPRPIHPRYDRVISVREAARLHGFPDWFRFTAAKWHGFRQVGNAVCPPLAKAVAESVRDALELQTERPGRYLRLGDESLLRVPSGAGRRSSPSRKGRARAA
jgi:DNA (cytosine-5)-methyltransferase 1